MLLTSVNRGRVDVHDPVWGRSLVLVILGLLALRLALLAFGLAPLHFDEAQYWSYGEDLDLGYYSKPPLIAWLIRVATELWGDTAFGVRFFAPLLHGAIAWFVFLSGRHLFDAQTGFWAGTLYLLLPGVTISSGLMTTDPPMMLGWAMALYALARVCEPEPYGLKAHLSGDAVRAPSWAWILLGCAVGLGMLGKYTMIAFVIGAIAFALLSREGGWRGRIPLWGLILSVVFALIVLAPNLWWNAQNGFATIAHVGDNANMAGGPKYNFAKAAEFFAAQAAIFGPLLFVGLFWLIISGDWRADESYRMLLWLTLPLILGMTVQAFLSRAHPNWSAPAYIAGTLAVAAFALDRGKTWLLRGSVVIGLLVLIAFTALAVVYDRSHADLPRKFDPFKKMRPGPPICEKALGHWHDGEKLLSDDRRLLAECMFAGSLSTSDIAIWNADGVPGNHYELIASLRPGDEGPFILVMTRAPGAMLDRFEEAQALDAGEIRTHADRSAAYHVYRVTGFRGYSQP
ncbi:MAG: glycosyltransferase family 39 protein [Neomegalonema sp.]|nr:glycosyltransferase family 39 protein [Neomegalonema sp.]